MSALGTPIRFFNLQAPKQDGILRSLFDANPTQIEDWVRFDNKVERYVFVQPLSNPVGNRKWDPVDVSTYTMEVAIGATDTVPTGGTFDLSYAGDGSSLSGLAYNITAANLRAALAANSAILGEGADPQVVLLEPGVYQVTFVTAGARFVLVGNPNLLSPQSSVVVSEVVVGAVGVSDVQIIRLIQRPYAFQNSWTPLGAAAASITQVQTGTSGKPSIQRVTLDPEPYDGSFVATFGQAEVVRVLAKGNTGSAVDTATITTTTDSGGSLHDKVAAQLYDVSGNPIQILLSNGGTIVTPVPSGGRRIPVIFVNNDTANTIAGLIDTAVSADAVLDATASTSLVTVIQRASGARTAPAAGSSGFAVARTITGAFGILHATSFLIYDSSNSSVAVYLTQTGAAPATGNAALDASRYISVTIAATDTTATLVGALVVTAVDADADFTAVNTSGVVTITGAANGTRTAASAGTSTFGVSVTTPGFSFSPSIAWNSTALLIQQAIDPNISFIVITKSGGFSWDFQFVSNGAKSAITADVTALKVPIGIQGALDLSTEQMLLASIAHGNLPFTAQYQWKITTPDGSWTLYRVEITIVPNLIDFSTLASASLVALTGVNFRVKAGGTFQLWNPDQSLWFTIGLAGGIGAETFTITTPGEA